MSRRGVKPTAPKPSVPLPEFRVISLGGDFDPREVERALNQGYTLSMKFNEFVVLQRPRIAGLTKPEPEKDIVTQARELASEGQRLDTKSPFDA